MSSPQYLPLTPGLFSLLVALAALVLVAIQLGILRYAYLRLGLSPAGALLLLGGSLIGSYFNIPLFELGGQRVLTDAVVNVFGMAYPTPVLVDEPGTVLAVNVGGAIIPTVMSIYLLVRYGLWVRGAIATAIVAAFVHWMATPVPGLGIAVPVFVPALATAVIACVLAREHAPALAYIAGSLGTLIGADLLNLDKIASMGPSVASIGGAGRFDGIFLTGIVAVLLASFYAPPKLHRPAPASGER